MKPLAVVRVDWHGDVPVAAIDGEVDASNAGEVGGDLRALVTNRSTDLVVDLSPTRYLDSAGINLLFRLGEELRARQLELRLVIADGSPVAPHAQAHRARPRARRLRHRGRRARGLSSTGSNPAPAADNPGMSRTRLVLLCTLLAAAAPAVFVLASARARWRCRRCCTSGWSAPSPR